LLSYAREAKEFDREALGKDEGIAHLDAIPHSLAEREFLSAVPSENSERFM
jgi:hypothetical protein